jgi:hypothetical protein
MSKKEMTLVYYHIPQDSDDRDTPNVFGVHEAKHNIRLKHIYDSFPLRGQYIFRFKVMYESAAAWADVTNPEMALPTFKDRIVLKATRVTWENSHGDDCFDHYSFTNRVKATSNSQQLSEEPQQIGNKAERNSVSATVNKGQTEDLLNGKHEAEGVKVGSKQSKEKEMDLI